jgi:ketosteroid isomerase-like protein
MRAAGPLSDTDSEIQAIVDRETRAWNTQDVDLLISVFHPDMVWPWPPTARDHDPMDWVMEWGRYDPDRWRDGWQKLFDTHDLVQNDRVTRKIVVSDQGDGAFAVVDINTVWKDQNGAELSWTGRTCKIYTKMGDEWKMIAQTGVLDYSEGP